MTDLRAKNELGVSVERTGYRDNSLAERLSLWGDSFIAPDISQEEVATSISKRHREMWGYDCPATNIDFLMLEYNSGSPVAIVDYKRRIPKKSKDYQSTKNIDAVRMLANNSKIPYFNAYYTNSNWVFVIQPLNDIALKCMNAGSIKSESQIESIPNIYSDYLSEKEFVVFLYHLRNLMFNKICLNKLNGTKEWIEKN